MEDGSLEDRSVEVLQIPDDLDDDLLLLYFENRRRSGGGNVISLKRTGDKAVLVFENVEGETLICMKCFIIFLVYFTNRALEVCVCVLNRCDGSRAEKPPHSQRCQTDCTQKTPKGSWETSAARILSEPQP